MDTLVKKLTGYSGSIVELHQEDGRRYVKKIGNVTRNYERLMQLQGIVPVPSVYYYDGERLNMEYIHGHDMKTYLINNAPTKLIEFLIQSLTKFSMSAAPKDYTQEYEKWLSIDEPWNFSFTKSQLLERLPKVLPQSTYHGDMTLENVISTPDGFYFIDPVTLPFDSYVFDIAKLRQDVDCKWFLRYNNIKLETKLLNISESILSKFPEGNNDYILILMLLRVFRHCEPNTVEYDFIMKEVNRLWKL